MIAISQFTRNTQKVQVLRHRAFRVMDENKAKRINWLMLESYLGTMFFDDDLHLTCAEFYFELKKLRAYA